jgi:hypothetical protein
MDNDDDDEDNEDDDSAMALVNRLRLVHSAPFSWFTVHS